MKSIWQAVGVAVATLLLLAVMYGLAQQYGLTEIYDDMDSLVQILRQQSWTGPMLVMALMALAIVFNPLPSAPLALAAGAVYGHSWGTVLIIAGATTGAVIAFMIARLTGYEAIRKILPRYQWLDQKLSQNRLMLIIFVSRLIPFLSFDLISYAAGLTRLALWRFFLATLFGLVPASFLLAHFGGEIAGKDFQYSLTWVLLLGLLTVPPLLLGLYRYLHGALSRPGRKL